jgi:hypothetical protein
MQNGRHKQMSGQPTLARQKNKSASQRRNRFYGEVGIFMFQKGEMPNL